MVQYHHYTLEDILNMIPFEKDLTVDMIKEKIERESQ